MYPSTTPEMARQLLASDAMAPVTIDGHRLTAYLVESGPQYVPQQVDGVTRWVQQTGYDMVFNGGRWGPHSLRCSVSSPERILAHWDGYKQAHTQTAERRQKAREIPAGTKYLANSLWFPKVDDRIYFPRGIFGTWAGRITRIYEARGHIGMKKGTALVDVTCLGANGNVYNYKGVRLSECTHNGKKPHLEE